MTKDELLKRMNAFTQKRYGSEVTRDMVRDWVVEEIVPQAIPHGIKQGQNPDWEWNYRHYRRILQICRIRHFLKESGQPERLSLIRIELWLMKIKDIPFDLVRGDLQKEFNLMRTTAMRPVKSDFDPRNKTELSDRRQKALINQTGKAEPKILPKKFSYLPHELIGIMQLSNFGKSFYGINVLLSSILKRMGLDFLLNMDLFELKVFSLFIRGYLGDPDEIDESAEEIIKNADEQTFNLARDYVSHFKLMDILTLMQETKPNFLNVLMKFRKIFAIIDFNVAHGRWRIAVFMFAFIAAHRNPQFIRERLEDILNCKTIRAEIGSFKTIN